MTIGMKSMVSPPSLNVSTTPILATGCRQCLPLSVVQLKGKHCRKPHCHNGVVDTFELCLSSLSRFPPIVHEICEQYFFFMPFATTVHLQQPFPLRARSTLKWLHQSLWKKRQQANIKSECKV